MSESPDSDLAARTRARLESAKAKVKRLTADLAHEEALVRELQALVDPERGGGGRSGKVEIERRITAISKILLDRGPLALAPLHTEAMKVEGDDFSKQTLIDLLRRKDKVFVSLANGWGLCGVHDSPEGRDGPEYS